MTGWFTQVAAVSAGPSRCAYIEGGDPETEGPVTHRWYGSACALWLKTNTMLGQATPKMKGADTATQTPLAMPAAAGATIPGTVLIYSSVNAPRRTNRVCWPAHPPMMQRQSWLIPWSPKVWTPLPISNRKPPRFIDGALQWSVDGVETLAFVGQIGLRRIGMGKDCTSAQSLGTRVTHLMLAISREEYSITCLE
jgi:hypothetical protein